MKYRLRSVLRHMSGDSPVLSATINRILPEATHPRRSAARVFSATTALGDGGILAIYLCRIPDQRLVRFGILLARSRVLLDTGDAFDLMTDCRPALFSVCDFLQIYPLVDIPGLLPTRVINLRATWCAALPVFDDERKAENAHLFFVALMTLCRNNHAGVIKWASEKNYRAQLAGNARGHPDNPWGNSSIS